MRLDVVLLQECKADLLSAPAVERALAGWRIFWAHNSTQRQPGSTRGRPPAASQQGSGSNRRNKRQAPSSQQQRNSAGVAIAIRAALLQEQGGPAKVTDVRPSSDGRLLSLRLDWGGHQLRLASIYMPNQPTAQRSFLEASLGQLAAQTGRRAAAVWGGDFNFVEDQKLDRVTSRRSHAAEQRTAAAWQERLKQLKVPLVDAFRHLHPTRRSYSHFSPSGAARLDRFYVPEQLLPHVAAATVGERRPSTSASACSDHRPITLEITPRTPTTLPHNPLKRLRLHFAADASLARQFEEQAAAAASAAPASAAAFVAWWPRYKQRITTICSQLNRQWRQAQQQASDLPWEEQEQLYQRYQQGDETALPTLLAHRQHLAATIAAELADRSMQQRRQWLHNGERPSPAITRQLQPPAESRGIPALRSPAGTLHAAPHTCAQLVANYWAAISTQPPVSTAAQRAVLSGLEGAPKLGEQQAERLGCSTVAAAEVRRALRRSKPGTAPGRDGIPVQLYRKFSAIFQPLLARLFSSIGASGQLPRGFHDGVISVLHKKGARSDPANYRPITLLNTDYRLLSKILAHRLGAVLPGIIGAEQTAFIRGRSIGENNHLLQLLPHVLARQRRWAMVVFCDFRKAYDTVDRGFLLEIMRTLGLGAGFLNWAHLLLTNTRAAALVNGHLSKPTRFWAGVRQGCPLAPLLYLCLGQALLRFLERRGVGIDVAGRKLAAMQYADDCKALLPGSTSSQLQRRAASFVAAMRTFAAASGQQLAEEKTKMLPIGAVPEQLPASLAGLQVVSTATALGLTFRSGTQPPQADWKPRLEQLEACYTKLAKLQLSAFGRGIGSAAYGVSKLLYHAEYAGMPPNKTIKHLNTITAKLIDRSVAPSAADRPFKGVAALLLAGNPRSGGFGAIPWQQHVLARHAAWGVRLALADPDKPWAAVAAAALQQVDHQLAPAALLGWHPTVGQQRELPPALMRMWRGLRALPHLQIVGPPPQPGPWCSSIPIWNNPWLAERTPSYCPADWHGWALRLSNVRYIPDILLLHHQAQRGSSAQLEALQRQHFDCEEAAEELREQIAQVVQLIPTAWQQAAWEHLGSTERPSEAEATAMLLGSLGWQRQQGEPLTLAKFKVRHGTTMQLGELQTQRLQRFAAFEKLAAGGGGSQTTQPDGTTTAQLLRRLWRLPWDNKHKEIFWRLALNGLPVAARMPRDGKPCGCGSGGPLPDRRHHFWDCPVAAAVVHSLTAQLGGQPLSTTSIWLAKPPPGLHGGAWGVVCLAAISAMDSGRRSLFKLGAAPATATAGSDMVAVASQHAVARFWILLQDFCSLNCAPVAWQSEMSPTHPFLYWQSSTQSWQITQLVPSA